MNPPTVVGITPGDHGTVDRWPVARALARAGLRTILVREPHLDRHALEAFVLNLWATFPQVVLHDRHPRARAYGSPIHLPAHGEPGDFGAPWSRSCHTEAEVDRALAQGAAWVTLSPVWRPTSKPDDSREPLGPDRFLAIARGRPVVALGGITPERAALLASHGVGVAVSGFLFDQPTPEAAERACAELVQAWKAAYEPVLAVDPVGLSSDSGSPTGNKRSS